MNRQETFDKVATHLFAQGKQSKREDNSCLYRGPENTRCAVGCLIPDEVYREDMEENTIASLLDIYPPVGVILGIKEKDDLNLLRDLQLTHDQPQHWLSTTDMKIQLRAVAQKFKLDHSVLDNVRFNDR